MKKKNMVVVAVLFSVLLLLPRASADVYVPPGPWPTMDAWISPTLMVIDMQDMQPVGWMYSDGPMYDNELQVEIPKIHKESPVIVGKLNVEFSTKVVVFGWIPKVVVSPDQVPPPVEIVITWNGIPYVVTLTLPPEQVVGWVYPPELYPDQENTPPYEFAWPAESPFKDTSYNIWVGDIDDIRDQLAFTLPDKDFPSGYFFWYIFHPNAGDWIAFDCQPGKTKHPPTYDITALFEYSTSQIWFNHIAFDVRFLEVHKTILPNPIIPSSEEAQTLVDTISIKNLGKVPATEIDILQTFPSNHAVSVNPKYYTAQAKIIGADGEIKIGPTLLDGFGSVWPYPMPPPFDTLLPGEELIITMDINVAVALGWCGTIVFDVVVSAAEIPEWKYPRSMEGLIVVGDVGESVPLWVGWELVYIPEIGWRFMIVPEWFVPTPIIRMEPEQMKPQMTLDPVPVDLNGDGKIDAQDIALVRQAIVGLIPYDYRMDTNVNGVIDTQDLAAFKLEATG
jgi:hypothetical protein